MTLVRPTARTCAICGKKSGAIGGFRTALRHLGYPSEAGYAHEKCIRRVKERK